ncbi:MAG: hypothetical protein H6874_09350 [Hyphomicrobiaceae bacterium]|nr:hypothetical protein [Hyphomicrobiaceae bacterium]
MTDSTQYILGQGSQLFIDNSLIEQSDSVTRRWHKPERLQNDPVLVADQPWEDFPYFTYSNFNVHFDPHDGLVKCWYEDLGPMHPYQTHPWKSRILYAESEDGIHFRKPDLGIEVDGRPTNIVCGYVEGAESNKRNPWAHCGVHSTGIVIDPDPTSSSHRYRMLFSRAEETGHGNIECAHSADGIIWKRDDEPPKYGNAGSSLGDVSILYYDAPTKLFVHHTRHGSMHHTGQPANWPKQAAGEGGFFPPSYPLRPDLMNKRRIFRSVSADFENWTDLAVICEPTDERDNLDDGFYGMPMFRAGQHYFGTLGVLHYVDNEMDVRLMQSHDGVHWSDTDNAKPFLKARGEGHWDRHMVSMTSAPVKFGDRWLFHFGGSLAHHDYWMSGRQKLDHDEARDPAAHVRFGMGVAEMRFEGIASLEARKPRLGRIVTRPVRTSGSKVLINARCKPGGSIRVAVADSVGNILKGRDYDDCVPFDSDAVEHVLSWADGGVWNAGNGPSEYHKLMFLIDDAELFSFAVRG